MKKTRAEEKSVSEKTYQKYLKKYDEKAPENINRAKKVSTQKRADWWKSHWIEFLALVIAAVTGIVTLWSELR